MLSDTMASQDSAISPKTEDLTSISEMPGDMTGKS